MYSLMKITAAAVLVASSALAQDTPAPSDAQVYFVNLSDGDTVSSPVTVIFGLAGMGVAPAGTEKENTGHHHLLIDRAPFGEGPDGAEELTLGLPADDNHIHFGGGQTQVAIELTPGSHTMQLVLGDLNHIPHATPVTSEVIAITVE